MSVFPRKNSKTQSSLNFFQSGPRKFTKSDFSGLAPIRRVLTLRSAIQEKYVKIGAPKSGRHLVLGETYRKVRESARRVSWQYLSFSLGACAMTAKFLDNKICTFKILLLWRFPRKQAFLDDFPLCPRGPPPPLKSENFIFIVVSPSLIPCAARKLLKV